MEIVIIESELINFNDKNLQVEMRMYNKDKSQLKSIIWCGFAFFNLITQKRETHTEDLMQLFKNVYKPADAKTFEDRLNQLK